MKSLLVDALRKANGTATEEPVEESPGLASTSETQAAGDLKDSASEQARESPPEERQSDVMAFESTSIATESTPASPPDLRPLPADTATQEVALAGRSTVAEGYAAPILDGPASAEDDSVDDPALELPALDMAEIELEAEPSVESTDAVTPTDEPAAVGILAPVRGDRLATLARLSPALCVVVLTAAAGSLVIYQNMTAQDPVSNLGMSAPTTPAAIDDLAVTPVWQVLAETHADQRREPVMIQPEAELTVSRPVAVSLDDDTAGNKRSTRTAANESPPLDPHFSEVQYAYSLYRSGRLTAAADAYQAVLEKDRLHQQALSGLAAVLQRQSRPSEAAALYERLLLIDPGDSAAAAALATQADNAESQIKSRLQQEPRNAAFHFALGLVMSEQERWPEAFESFTTAQNLSPGNADYCYNAAVSAHRLGLDSTARELYARVLATMDGRSMVDRQTVQTNLLSLAESGRGVGL